MHERTHLEQNIASLLEISSSVGDYTDLITMAEEEGDEEILKETEKAIESLSKKVDRLRLESLLSGEADNNDAYLQVNAGAGGNRSAGLGGDDLTHVYALGRQ